MPGKVYVRDLAEPIQRLVRSLSTDCAEEELLLLRQAKKKDASRVAKKLDGGADPVVLFVELKNRLRGRRARSSSSSSQEDRKRRSKSRSSSRSRSRSAEAKKRKKKKQRKRRSSRSRSHSGSDGSDSSATAAARRREERRKRLAVPQNMIAAVAGSPLPGQAITAVTVHSQAVALAAAVHTAHCRVYVGNVVFEVEEPEIRQVFEAACGPIKIVEMSKDALTGTHKGYCFIEFVSPQGALYALEAMNGHRLHGRGIKVGRPNNAANSIAPALLTTVEALLGIPPMAGHKFLPPGEVRIPVQPTPVKAQVYVAGVPATASDETLRAEFGQCGPVVALTRRPDKYFALVEYNSHLVAEQAVAKLDGQVIGGCRVRLGRALAPPQTAPPSRCIVLLNMVAGPEDVDDALGHETQEHCKKYGDVEHVLMYDELNPLTQKVEVKCFVLFTAVASATRAQTALNGRSFGGRRVQCHFFSEDDFRRILET